MKEVYTAVPTKDVENPAIAEAKVAVKTDERGCRICSLRVRLAVLAAVFLIAASVHSCNHHHHIEPNTVSSQLLRTGNDEPQEPSSDNIYGKGRDWQGRHHHGGSRSKHGSHGHQEESSGSSSWSHPHGHHGSGSGSRSRTRPHGHHGTDWSWGGMTGGQEIHSDAMGPVPSLDRQESPLPLPVGMEDMSSSSSSSSSSSDSSSSSSSDSSDEPEIEELDYFIAPESVAEAYGVAEGKDPLEWEGFKPAVDEKKEEQSAGEDELVYSEEEGDLEFLEEIGDLEEVERIEEP